MVVSRHAALRRIAASRDCVACGGGHVIAGPDGLRADCARCTGLGCVAPAFVASSDFAISKPSGRPCPNLLADFRCGIHDGLRELGFTGCTVFDCFGAGQQVSQVTFPGRSWRESPELADAMFGAFTVLRGLHEMLWYLDDAIARPAAGALRPALTAIRESLEELAGSPADVLSGVDVDAHRIGVGGLLLQASGMVRGEGGGAGRDHRRADLAGARLRGDDLSRADLRGALLLGADLRDADLRTADLLGADLRGADLRGADLRDALFLTQPQVQAARGDGRTRLPSRVSRPSSWAG